MTVDPENLSKRPFRVTVSGDVEMAANRTFNANGSTFTGVSFASVALPVVDIEGTSHTLSVDDQGKRLRSTSGSETTVTVPPQSEEEWADNAYFFLSQNGAGKLVIAEGDGVTINVESGYELALRGQNTPAMLVREGEDEWSLYGSLEESS